MLCINFISRIIQCQVDQKMIHPEEEVHQRYDVIFLIKWS